MEFRHPPQQHLIVASSNGKTTEGNSWPGAANGGLLLGKKGIASYHGESERNGMESGPQFGIRNSKEPMNIYPDMAAFADFADRFALIPVYRRLLCDGLTPVSAFKLLDDPRVPGCLFESVIGGEKVGRYSIIAVGPRQRVIARGKQVLFQQGESQETLDVEDPLAFLNEKIGKRSVAPAAGLPPFIGGAIGYAAYDVVRYVEDLPNVPFDDRHLPDLDFGFYDNLVIFDHINKTMIVSSLVEPGEYASRAEAYEAARTAIDGIVAKLSQPVVGVEPIDIELTGMPPVAARSNFTQEEFVAAVQKCDAFIKAGDIFQVVISQRLDVDFTGEPLEIYRSLRVINPSPFMFFVRTPEATLVGASPEVMCRVVDGLVTVRPLAGTRPRGQSEDEDLRLAKELLADPKERAEHVMLVDLGRNDVGRVAVMGSVSLSHLMEVERYSHVMHISSTVEGRLRPDLDAMDALKACLPAGTVSGAPKVRAMEIIDEIEPTKRGPYAGAVGYIDYRGNMDTCIALRTIVVTQGKAYIQAGAGLVADSEPTAEYQETLNKARAMLRAIEATQRRAAKVTGS